MLNDMTRGKVIQVWFGGLVVAVAGGVAMGVSVTASTAAVLAVMAVVVPAIVLLLWPRAPQPTIIEMLQDTDR
jgi:hypothetical protein